MFVIVPNEISEAIYERLDAELIKFPQFKGARETIYNQLLNYYDKTGMIPNFKLETRSDYENRRSTIK